MNIEVIKKYSFLSEQGGITFPDLLIHLQQADVELYYADLLASTKTYYSKNEVHVLPISVETEKQVATVFNGNNIAQALRSIQLGQIDYQEFLKQVMKAGVFSYFVFVKGWKSIYFGKLGEQYVEQFPSQSK